MYKRVLHIFFLNIIYGCEEGGGCEIGTQIIRNPLITAEYLSAF